MKKFGVIKDLLIIAGDTALGAVGLILTLAYTNGLMMVGIILFVISVCVWYFFIFKERRAY